MIRINLKSVTLSTELVRESWRGTFANEEATIEEMKKSKEKINEEAFQKKGCMA